MSNSILHKEYTVIRFDYAGAGKASSDIKKTLSTIGIPSAVLRKISVASYESEINMIIHAYGGVITMDVFDNGEIRLRAFPRPAKTPETWASERAWDCPISKESPTHLTYRLQRKELLLL